MHVPPRSGGALTARAERSAAARRVILPLQGYIHASAISGGLLIVAAIIALVWANSPWSDSYEALWHRTITVDLGFIAVSEDLQHWINDGLMALFFFVVGLEVKREFTGGELSHPRQAALPVAAAIGGMVFPAVLYVSLNLGGGSPEGWAIPVATDIAFALAILALLGRRVPPQVTVILLSLAIVDDIGSILIIALFYTSEVSFFSLALAAGLLAITYGMLRAGIREPVVLIPLGIAVWVATLESGVHATIAGVALAAIIPTRPLYSQATFMEAAHPLMNRFDQAADEGRVEEAEHVLGVMEELVVGTEAMHTRLERLMHPWVSYIVLPLFALANAGLVISGDSLGAGFSSSVTLGVLIGLVIGKPLGIMLISWVAVRLGVANLPEDTRWGHLLGVGLLAGIGFTVSLFITDLAFTEGEAAQPEAKLGILAASAIAAVLGFVFLRMTTGRRVEQAGAS